MGVEIGSLRTIMWKITLFQREVEMTNVSVSMNSVTASFYKGTQFVGWRTWASLCCSLVIPWVDLNFVLVMVEE